MSVTYPQGFIAAGVAAGLKASGGKDVAVVVNTGEHPAAAAVFTPNRFPAAPVQWSRQALARDGATPVAVVLNSGGANACTGDAGYQQAAREASCAAGLLGLDDNADVLVCSTGLIGELLPIDKVCAGIEQAVEQAWQLESVGGELAAEAILTTDTHPKTATARGDGYLIGGMAKGAGMLAPALATMLVVVTTDAAMTNDQAQSALAEAVRVTFNRLDSDGCQSTNDTVILLASGESGTTPDPADFTTTLTEVCADLAHQLIGDAEGAAHVIALQVTGATSEDAGLEVARAIARSNLVKTAIFGNDPNWGRILAAAGTVPAAVAPYDSAQVDVTVNGVTVCRSGGVGDDRSLVDLTPRNTSIDVDLHAGAHTVTLLTTDLTHDYVHENSAYSS